MGDPLSIEVRQVDKSFAANSGTWVPLRERIQWVRRQGARISVLEDISFEVHRGEVFGIVGPNGAGKSTLLKLIAGIYPIDRGRIRVGGRVAPLIELGVGFRPDLPARPNILLNGVMMGLSPAEAKRRTDQIIEFAELEKFTELKLKNYSSGMRGRLGFSVMTHVDADVLLIDEILSVGDKSFRDKCGNVIAGMRERGKTVVLVSHEMGSINRHCDRALLLHDHRVESIGEPEDVANSYLSVNSRKRWSAAAQACGGRGHRRGGGAGLRRRPRGWRADAAVEVAHRRRSDDRGAAAAALPGGPLHDPRFRRASADRDAAAPARAGPRSGQRHLPRLGQDREPPRRGPLRAHVPCHRAPDRGRGARGLALARALAHLRIEGPDEPGSVVSVDTEISVEPAEVEADPAGLSVR